MAARQRGEWPYEGDVTQHPLVQRLGAMAAHMRSSQVLLPDDQLSPAERLVRRALMASGNGDDAPMFWSVMFRELRAWLDEPGPTCA